MAAGGGWTKKGTVWGEEDQETVHSRLATGSETQPAPLRDHSAGSSALLPEGL